MPAAVAKVVVKILAQLISTDDGKRIVGFLIAGAAGLAMLVVMLPMLLLSMPFASNTQIAQYVQISQTIHKRKGVVVPWQDLAAIDAVRYRQNFNKTSSTEITQLAGMFLVAHKHKTETCHGTGKSRHCTKTIKTTYTLRPLSVVMTQLGLSAQQQQQVNNMVQSLTTQTAIWTGAHGSAGVYQWMPTIQRDAQQSGVPPALIAAIMSAESGGNPDAVSSAGAEGVLQMMPSTAADWGVTNPFNPQQEIAGASRMIASLYQHYHGDITLVAAAYNAGSGAVARYGGVPPYPQTQAYVVKVQSAFYYYQQHPTASK